MLSPEIANLRPVFMGLDPAVLKAVLQLLEPMLEIKFPAKPENVKQSDYVTVVLRRINEKVQVLSTESKEKLASMIFSADAKAKSVVPGLRTQLIEMGKLKDLTYRKS